VTMPSCSRAVVLLPLLGVLLKIAPGAAWRDEMADDVPSGTSDLERKVATPHLAHDAEVPSSAVQVSVESSQPQKTSQPKKTTDAEKHMLATYGVKPLKVVRRRKKKASQPAAAVKRLVPYLGPLLKPSPKEDEKQVVEIRDDKQKAVADEEEEEIPTPEELISVDPCCVAGREPVAAEAMDSGTYTVTVRHAGLSLSADGKPRTCVAADTNMASVLVEYLCPQECFVDPLGFEDFMKIFTEKPETTEAGIEACSDPAIACKGRCYKANEGEWYHKHVISAEAPRLKGCSVKGGGRVGSDGKKVVMTSSCAGRFEDWRLLYWQPKAQ